MIDPTEYIGNTIKYNAYEATVLDAVVEGDHLNLSTDHGNMKVYHDPRILRSFTHRNVLNFNRLSCDDHGYFYDQSNRLIVKLDDELGEHLGAIIRLNDFYNNDHILDKFRNNLFHYDVVLGA